MVTILYSVVKFIKDAIGCMRVKQVSGLMRYNDIFISELDIDLYDKFINCVNDKDILLYYCDLIEAQYMGWEWHKLLHKIRDNVDLSDKDMVCDVLRERVGKRFCTA